MTTVAAVILAAGQGTRFQAASGQPESKLLAPLGDRPLVRHVAETALASRATPVVVVTGYRAAEVQAALAGLPLRFVVNTDFAAGLSTSLRAGIATVPAACRGALVLLADMPRVERVTLDALIARAEAAPDADAVVAMRRGERGNPVLLGRSLFDAVARLDGDEGARRLLSRPDLRIEDVEDGSAAILDDVDVPADLGRLQATCPGRPQG